MELESVQRKFNGHDENIVLEKRGFRDRVDFFENTTGINHSCGESSEPITSSRNQEHKVSRDDVTKKIIDQIKPTSMDIKF